MQKPEVLCVWVSVCEGVCGGKKEGKARQGGGKDKTTGVKAST